MEKLTIKIQADNRVLFLGSTGFGKTVLAKHFLQRMSRVLVIDPKHTFVLDGYKRSKKLPAFTSDFRVIYRPKLTDDFNLAELCRKMFKMKNCTIYVDELNTITEMYPLTTLVLADIARTGRERKVSVWSALQRPRWVPRIFITESELVFQFNLRSEEDRDYMTGFNGNEVFRKIDYFQFWYCHPKIDHPVLMRLDLDRDRVIIQG